MRSRSKARLHHPLMMLNRLRYARISTKITCFYAAVLLLVLIPDQCADWFGGVFLILSSGRGGTGNQYASCPAAYGPGHADGT